MSVFASHPKPLADLNLRKAAAWGGMPFVAGLYGVLRVKGTSQARTFLERLPPLAPLFGPIVVM